MEAAEKITIRKMEKSDLENVMHIEAEAYGSHHWSKDSFYNELSNNLAHYFCALNSENELLGYAGFWGILEEAHITTLAVSKNHRRNNIAQSLLFKIIDDCYEKKIKYITLEVRISNIPAISLYEKNGFRSIGTRKAYYQDNNEDALIMFTQNIWHDEFKSLYNNNKSKLTAGQSQ